MTDRTGWPTAPMLLWGTFGSGTPAGKRYQNRTAAAMAAVAVFALATSFLRAPVMVTLAMFTPALAILYITWEFRRYLGGLDELARRIQMEAICWTYLTGMVALAIAAGVGGLVGWSLNPIWFLLLEPVRGCWLVVTARRYE